MAGCSSCGNKTDQLYQTTEVPTMTKSEILALGTKLVEQLPETITYQEVRQVMQIVSSMYPAPPPTPPAQAAR